MERSEGAGKGTSEVSTDIPSIGETMLCMNLRGKLLRGELLARGFPNEGRVRLVDIPPDFWDYHPLDCEANSGGGRDGPRYTQVRIFPMPKPEAAAPPLAIGHSTTRTPSPCTARITKHRAKIRTIRPRRHQLNKRTLR